MTPDEAKRDYFRLLQQYEADLVEYKEKYSQLSRQDQLRVNFSIIVPGLPKRPRHPAFVRTHETPHPHILNMRMREGYVWVNGTGWMTQKAYKDILQWAE
jgi:hypothetical protein